MNNFKKIISKSKIVFINFHAFLQMIYGFNWARDIGRDERNLDAIKLPMTTEL